MTLAHCSDLPYPLLLAANIESGSVKVWLKDGNLDFPLEGKNWANPSDWPSVQSVLVDGAFMCNFNWLSGDLYIKWNSNALYYGPCDKHYYLVITLYNAYYTLINWRSL